MISSTSEGLLVECDYTGEIAANPCGTKISLGRGFNPGDRTEDEHKQLQLLPSNTLSKLRLVSFHLH